MDKLEGLRKEIRAEWHAPLKYVPTGETRRGARGPRRLERGMKFG